MALIAHWPLNGDTNDISGNELHGTPTNITYTDGKIGQAASFNGDTSYITTSYNLNYNNDFTVTCWMKRDLAASWVRAVEFGHGDYPGLIGMHTNEQGFFGYYRADGITPTALYYDINTYANQLEWFHVTVLHKRISSTEVYRAAYVNGVLSNSHTITDIKTDYTGNVAISTSASNRSFNGDLNDVRIYNTALTDMEIQEIARAKILHYTFDDMQEPTTNYGRMLETVSLQSGLSGHWSIQKLNRDTLKVTAIVNNPNLATWGDVTMGISGTRIIPAGKPVTLSCEIVDFRGSLSRIYPASGGFGTIIGFGTFMGRNFRTITHTADWTHNFLIRASDAANIVAGDYVTIRFTQIEEKAYPTEYTENTRTGRVNDYSGFFNHSEPLTETTTPRWTADAKIGTGGYTFTPISNDSIYNENNAKMIDNTLVQLPYDQYTVSFWTYRTASGLQGGSYMRFGNYNAGVGFDTYDWVFNILAGQGAGVSLASVSLSTTLNQWEHTTLVFNRLSPNILKKYTNGIFVANGTQNLAYINNDNTPTGYPFKIGTSFAGGVARPYNGIIDDVRIYATALSDADILDLYETRAEIEESGVLYAKDFQTFEQEESEPLPTPEPFSSYTLATDADFDGTTLNSFKYIGTDDYVLLPAVIKGVTLTSTRYMFSNLNGPTTLKGVATSNSNLDRTDGMFRGASATSLDLTYFDVSNVTNMYLMFYQNSTTEIIGLGTWDTSKVTNMSNIFNGSGVTTLDIGGFNTSLVTTFNNIFFNTSNLTTLDFSKWDFASGADLTNIIAFSSANPVYVGSQEDKDAILLTTVPDPNAIIIKETSEAAGITSTGLCEYNDFSTVGITDGLVGYWPLDKNSKNYSENHYTMLESGVSHNGNSAFFATYPAYIMTNSTNNISTLKEYTYSISIYRTDSQDAFLIMGSRLGNNTYQSLAVIGNKACLHKYGYNNNGDINVASSTINLGLNQWYHIVITYNNGDTKTYVNGVLEGTGMHINSSYSNQNFQFNYETSITDTYRFFRGYMKDAKVFNRALAPEEIAIEYNTMFNNEVQIHESGVLYAKDIKQY